MNIYGITEEDMARPDFPDENQILEHIMNTMREILDDECEMPEIAAIGISIDFFVLDYYMKNGKVPTAWRK